jgi:hypothetical protein
MTIKQNGKQDGSEWTHTRNWQTFYEIEEYKDEGMGQTVSYSNFRYIHRMMG